MKFKTMKIEKEYSKLSTYNPKMQSLLVMLDAWTRAQYNKEITLTHLFRTDQEQIDLYAQTPAAERPAKSPHQTWEAVDLRSTDWSKKQQDAMCELLNKSNTNPGGKKTAFVHAIAGNVEHFHIQVLL